MVSSNIEHRCITHVAIVCKLKVSHLVPIRCCLHIISACACTTGGVQALSEASIALHHTDGWTSVQADDAFRAAQQGYGVNVTQPAFIAAATQHGASSDNDLSAFLTGAGMNKGTYVQ